MAGTCKRCKGETTNTRGASMLGLCHACEHGYKTDHQPLDGLTHDEVLILDTYNAEVERGIVHTAEWSRRMEEFQQRFNS